MSGKKFGTFSSLSFILVQILETKNFVLFQFFSTSRLDVSCEHSLFGILWLILHDGRYKYICC